MQFAWLIIMVRYEGDDLSMSPIWNRLELGELIGLNEWHSFCYSINLDLKMVSIIQNGKTIAEKEYEMSAVDAATLTDLMPYAYVGCHTGSVADIQIFARPLPYEDMYSWTLCTDQGKVSILIFPFS